MRKSRRIWCALLLVAVFISLLPSCGKRGTRSENAADFIAFLSDRSGDYYLYTMSSDGSDRRKLEEAWSYHTSGRDPLLSPSRTRIAFAQANRSQGWAMIVNADGSGMDTLVMETLLSWVYLGDWSPDGSKLVYRLESTDASKSGVYVINPDGSGKLRLDQGFDPRFCGNDKVVYVGYEGIYVIGTNGQDKRRLQEALFGVVLEKPAGSSDGKWVAFCRGLVVPPPNQRCWLEIIESDSSEQIQLAEIPNVSWIDEIEFSPDNKRILVLAVGEMSAEIYVVNTDGSDFRPLTNNSAVPGGTRWSPDGSRIVFTSTKDGNQEIYTVNTSGIPLPRRLTYDLAYDNRPDW